MRTKLLALADHPRGAQQVVARRQCDGEVAGGLGLRVDAERGQRLVLGVVLDGAVEDVLRRVVHQREAVLAGQPGQGRGRGGVGRPGRASALGRLRRVDRGVGRGVEDHGVLVPRPGGDRVGVGDVELGPGDALGALERGHQRLSELTAGAEDQRPLRRHRGDVAQPRGGEVLVGDLRLVERDRPRDGRRLVAQVEGRVGHARSPVVVDEVGVGRAVLERLVAVADAARDEDRDRRVDLEVERRAEGLALAHVDPGAEDAAGGQRDELVPRLGVDAAGGAARGVEGDVVLHRPEVGQPERHHLLALPVLLEPAPGVTVQGHPHDQQARDRRLLDGQLGHHWPLEA